jgi:hypothetical protein
VRTLLGICLGLAALLLQACAGLAPWGPEPQALPPLDAAKGRIVFYRSSSFGAQYASDALLNGERVGRIDRPGMYFRDVAPGSYTAATTRSSRVAHFSLAAGERKYLRFSNDFLGTVIYPELVEPARGERETAGLERLDAPRK